MVQVRLQLRKNRNERATQEFEQEPLYGTHTILGNYERGRSSDAAKRNKSRGKGKNSPYKLTGLGNSYEWEREARRRIDNIGLESGHHKLFSGEVRQQGIDIVARRALEKWLKKPEAYRKEMEEWLERNKEWVKKYRARK